jgi:hypothetical protein
MMPDEDKAHVGCILPGAHEPGDTTGKGHVGFILPGAHEPEDTTGKETHARGGAVKDEHHLGGKARTVGRTGDNSAVARSKKHDGRDGESPIPSPAGAGLALMAWESVCESTDAPHQQLVDASRSLTGIYVLEVEREVSTSDLREYFVEQMSAGKEIAGLLEDRPGIALIGGSLVGITTALWAVLDSQEGRESHEVALAMSKQQAEQYRARLVARYKETYPESLNVD